MPLELGAREIDMVLEHRQAAAPAATADVRDDIAAVVDVAQAEGAIVKVIFENAYLDDEEKDPGVPAHRGSRRRLRQDVDRASRRAARRTTTCG